MFDFDRQSNNRAINPHLRPSSFAFRNLKYVYPVERLWSGGSYGNMACFARTDRLSNLDGLWHAGTNDWLCGRLDLRLEINGKLFAPDETAFYPSHQSTTFIGDGARAEKIVFVPYRTNDSQDGQQPTGEQDHASPLTHHSLGTFYTVLKLQATHGVDLRITCDVRWPATASTAHTKQPERHHIQRRVRQWIEDGTLWAQTVPFRVDRWDTVLGNADEVRALLGPEGGQATFSEPGRAQLRYTLRLGAGEEVALPFVLAAGTRGPDHLRDSLRRAPGWIEALASTVAAYGEILDTSLLLTPDTRINRGLQWAKANTVRVQHLYRHGAAFTNDPPQDIVVVRDCAWYGLGTDWLTPDFTASMYDLILRHGIHDGGKLTEYIHADTGAREDYALNINDDTPLFVMGVLHHYLASADTSFLHRVYPAVRQACEWILAQRRDGLVWCTVEGTDVWGNATWRNIIPGYRLAGAVTEINALCHAALLAGAELAEAVAAEGDASRWRGMAGELRAAINTLLATGDGLYLLNLDAPDANGTRTADLVFPLLGEVADPDRARRVLDLLYSPSFYTPYGIHTVPRDEAEYHPNFGHGLMGGLWSNLTAWVAYAGRKLYPERLAEMMSAIYALCEIENPLAEGHLVPGEFPEWFDGETWTSRGMAMSPWMPPTYLWLGIEGLAGISPATRGLTIDPNLPPHWDWLIVRNLPYRGRSISFFAYKGHLYTTHPAQSALPQTLFARDVTGELDVRVEGEGGLLVAALEEDKGTSILVAVPEGVGANGELRYRGRSQAVKLPPGKATLIRWES